MIKLKKLYVLLLIASFLMAGTDGTIRGKVTDIDGAPLPGANIVIPSLGLGAAADMHGNYFILNVPVGEYDVVIQMMGYQKQTIKGVHVIMDQTVWLNFKLPILNCGLFILNFEFSIHKIFRLWFRWDH